MPSNYDAPKRARWMRVVFPLAFLVIAAVLVVAVLQAVGMLNLWGLNNDAPVSKIPYDTKIEDGKNEPTPPGEPSSPEEPTPPKPPVVAQPDTGQGNPSAVPAAVPVIKDNTKKEGEFPDLDLEISPPNGPDTTGTNAEIPAPVPVGQTTTPPEQPTITEAPAPSSDPSPLTAGSLAEQALTGFLEAKTLDERLKYMSKSSLTREQLEKSSLAAPLREVKSRRMAEMVPSESETQYLYFVSFHDPDGPRQRQTLVMQLVERKGVHPPRVHGDAFVEHYEKKLTKFAEKPSEGVATFHVIAEARTSSMSLDVSREMRKNTVRLLIKSHPAGETAFSAYLNKKSPLMEKIGTRKDFPYTASRFCILSFRWSMDDKGTPYIELNDIVCQGWEK